MPARYHLRFQIHPGPDARADAVALAKSCAAASVDEVVLLLDAEELYTGHLTGAEADSWFETVAEARSVLLDAGIGVSLNPWVTVGHADRGRREDLGFAPMVSPTGETATAQASFACPRWRRWLTDHYGRYAELGFRVLWIEDDFRYQNHAPLSWGGGFEPLMLRRFAELSGARPTREQLVAAITAPGPPHPWRAQLQQVWRTAQLEVARLLADTVAERSGGRSQLGLMSSWLDTTSIEGRDWPALFDALAVEGRVAHRPHFAPYSDAPGRELSFSVWTLELQRALRPATAGCEPEVENWPHTAWSKSDTQTWSEMAAAQLAGSDALLLNVHPMHARRADRFPEVGDLLSRSRPALDWIADQQPRDLVTEGVSVPFKQDAAAHVQAHTPELEALAAGPGPAADFLLRFGVPITAGPAPVAALFGQLARAFDDDEVRALLAGGLLLDGVAAAVLVERGFGSLLGLREARLVDREERTASGPYAAEQVLLADDPSAVGMLLSVNVQPALARLEPVDAARRWTAVVTPDGRDWGTGRFGFRNELGGRVAVLAATAVDELPYNDDGQRLLHAMVRFLEGDQPRLPLVSGGPYLIPQLSRANGVRRLAVGNGCADPARVRVDYPRAPTEPRATLLAPLAQPRPVPAAVLGARVCVEQELPDRGWLVLAWE
ncbi:hypothetical protein [Streptacidiphilus sp. P02-A3a]|uniref:hypothetical protein n=1 Tax=Streptacidiphilus sp. P02-A3a TaxID=2704468 RepID=UPI0015FB6FB7|nr:hypothetical protein [Streptacidiphilus sp. P02-A3a]QMU71201.1 hypothetical protein GXP74_26250 [Streptacidiphilus sp. P02-A3a]